MRKLLFLLTVAVAAFSMSAAPVDPSTAAKQASNFLSQGSRALMMRAPSNTNLELKKSEMSSVKSGQAVYYIYTSKDAYVIVAGDDRAETILAYGDYCLDINNIPLGLQDMLNQFKDAIEFLQLNPGLKVDPAVSPKNTPSLRAESVGPLLSANWDQEAPYWNQCKFGSYQCLTGCPATSAAMVFYYWKFPTDPTPVVPAYDCTLYTSYWGSENYHVDALPSVTFDWDNMKDSYSGSYTTAEGNAVATLMRYIGQAERMAYGTSSAGGSGVDADSVCNICDAFLFFGYDPETTHYVKKTSAYSGGTTLYSDAEWAAMLQEEMFAERPVVFCAVDDSGNGGHAFNVDGYNGSTNKYHINFGWSGDGNNWLALNAFGYSYYNFSVYQQMVVGIQPPLQGPGIQVSPTKLNMEAFVEESKTATFTVKGQEITGNITLTLNDPSGYFAIDATSVAASDFENGKVITVTYSPMAVGTHTATVTLTNPDSEEKVVTLNGTATLETYKPMMQPADEAGINLTQFRADWTDQTADKFVDSYTLEVSTRPAVELLDSLNGNDYPSSYTSVTLTAPWSGNGVKAGNNAYYFSNYSNDGYIAFTVPDGYNNDVFTMQITTVSGTYGSGNLTVGSTQTAAVGRSVSSGQTYNWLVTASAGEQITITSTDSWYSPDMNMIKVYAGDVNDLNSKAVAEEGDANYRLITGITGKSYTVKNLEAGGTFFYKVKALYTDGTESAWSNSQCVTLFENGHGYPAGDVDHDGRVSIGDVAVLINYLISGGEICEICADANGDGSVNLGDMSYLIELLLTSE